MLEHELGDFARFARTDERCGINVVALLHDTCDDLRARRFGKRFEFDQLGFEWAFFVVGVDSDDNRSISQRSPSL